MSIVEYFNDNYDRRDNGDKLRGGYTLAWVTKIPRLCDHREADYIFSITRTKIFFTEIAVE